MKRGEGGEKGETKRRETTKGKEEEEAGGSRREGQKAGPCARVYSTFALQAFLSCHLLSPL